MRNGRTDTRYRGRSHHRMEHPRRREGVNSIALAIVAVALIVAATILTIYGHGDAVVTCAVMVFFMFVMLRGDI